MPTFRSFRYCALYATVCSAGVFVGLLGAVIADRRADGVFGQHRAVNFHRRQAELVHDIACF